MSWLVGQVCAVLKRSLSSQKYEFVKSMYHFCLDAMLSMHIVNCLQGTWSRRQWWIAKTLRFFFSEEWLYERHWRNVFSAGEKQFWDQLNSQTNLMHSLCEEEEKKIAQYESRYTKIKVYVLENNAGIGGLGLDYSIYVNDRAGCDTDTCTVLFVEGLLEGDFKTWNAYLTDRLQKTFETITKETYSFWRTYLNRNRSKITVINTDSNMKQMNEEVYYYFQTGEKKEHKTVIQFSEEEKRHGQEQIRDLDIKEPYICIFARDSRYNSELRLGGNAGYSIRDSDINDFKMTTKHFKKKHIQSIRMGALMREKYVCDGAIDYANHGRTDFLDIFIFSKCQFFVSGVSGILSMAYLLNVCSGCINIQQILAFWDRPTYMDIGIFVKYYDPQKKRYMRLREIAEMQIRFHSHARTPRSYGGTDSYDTYVAQHYEIVYNTPAEILDVAKELEAIQNHSIQYTEHDEKLQQRHRDLVCKYLQMYPLVTSNYVGRIGMQWLRDNEWFLE